jgi:U4/U6.U5 tri-snRNP-associated protein 2
MLIQAISEASKMKFWVGHQAEAGEFMAWLLNQLHIGLGGGKKVGSSIVYQCFQGKVEVTTWQRKLEDEDDKKKKNEEDEDEAGPQIEETMVDTQFLQLTLNIPKKPLFRDDDGGLVIPQEPLVTVLKKFDGVNISDALSQSGAAQRKQYRLRELPPYLILHLSHFKTNRYSREKNPTIVAFPFKNLDLSAYTLRKNGRQVPPTEEEVRKMDVSVLY